MDIRVTSTNRTFFSLIPKSPPFCAKHFLRSLSWSQRPCQKLQPYVERFGLTRNVSGFWAIQRNFGPQVDYFDGYPFQLKTVWPSCSAEVLHEYARRFVPRSEVNPFTPEATRLHFERWALSLPVPALHLPAQDNPSDADLWRRTVETSYDLIRDNEGEKGRATILVQLGTLNYLEVARLHWSYAPKLHPARVMPEVGRPFAKTRNSD
jgi:hypothetical protein